MVLHKTLVLDANILVRAVLSTKVRTLLEQSFSNIRFFAPDVCFDDAEKYLPLIFEETQTTGRIGARGTDWNFQDCSDC